MKEAPPGPLPYWFVVFQHADSMVWHHVLRPGFRHVWCFSYDPLAERWVVFDAAFQGFYIRVLDGAMIDALISGIVRGGGTILRCKTESHAVKRPLIFASCVTAIARTLGLPTGCALMPYGLYRTLLARGASHAFGTGDNANARKPVWWWRQRRRLGPGAGGAAARSGSESRG